VSQVSPQLSPELARGLLNVARSLLVATRNWSLYPPEHPAVQSSVERLCDAIRQSSLGSAFGIGITPDTLLIDGIAPTHIDGPIAEAAALLHDRDLLHLTFLGDVPHDGVTRLLRLLNVDADERRRGGGPAKLWEADGHPSLILEQVDYEKLFAREEGEVAEPARRDDLWRSIVMTIAGGQKAVFDERAQQRLLDIAGSAPDIGDLATEVARPKCAMDGSPMITSQAAAVLAAFRHLTSIVSVMSPDQLPDVMNNLATAAGTLDPHVVMQLMQTPDDDSGAVPVVAGIAAAFDDTKVAQLLATALALEGRASDRLATIFNTIAPDEDRKRRVLTMTRHMLSETDFGKSGQFQQLWTSAEELLISYNDADFVSDSYRTALDNVGGRAERLATGGELPPELSEWLDTLGQENVRSLSVMLLIDLLSIERDAGRAVEITHDMAALAEDLLLSGAYEDARVVTRALGDRADKAAAIGREACKQALDRLGESSAMRETALLLGDLDDPEFEKVRAIVKVIGPASIEAVKPLLMVEQENLAFQRTVEMVVAFKRQAVGRLASLAEDGRWYVQRNAAKILGRIGAVEGVPLLQPLLRKGDPRVARAAVSALGVIPDPAAARAIHTILRTATGEMRGAVIEALVADRDARVVPMLGRIVDESEALGKDHDVVLETMTALGVVGSDEAVAPLVRAIQVRSFWRRKKARAVKERGIGALARIGSEKAKAAIAEAATTGDRALKAIAQGART
jgi:HEAT repeat protein